MEVQSELSSNQQCRCEGLQAFGQETRVDSTKRVPLEAMQGVQNRANKVGDMWLQDLDSRED